jgi:hypothetical protein
MKVRICFLVMGLVPLLYYGFVMLAPAGRAATVSVGFHQLGKAALTRIENAQEAESESDDVFQARLISAEAAMASANSAATSAADRRGYTQLVRYLQTVKLERSQMLVSGDAGPVDHEPTNAAKESAEREFN